MKGHKYKREEKRTSPRLSVPVYAGTLENSFPVGTLRNISMQGMFVQSTEPKEVGTSIDMRFQLPGQKRWVKIRAQVIRVNYPPTFSENGPYVPRNRPVDDNPGMGLKILSVAPECKAFLETFIHNHPGDS